MGHHSSLLQHLTKNPFRIEEKTLLRILRAAQYPHCTVWEQLLEDNQTTATIFDSPATWILWKWKWSLVSPALPGHPLLFYLLPAMGNYMGALETTVTKQQCLSLLLQGQQYYKQHLRREQPSSHHAFVWERCQGLVITRQSLMCLHWSLQHTAHSSINRSKQRVLLYICVAWTVC